MSDMLIHYGLFLAETATVVVAIGVVIALVAAAARRGAGEPESLEVRSLNDRLERFQGALAGAALPRRQRRAQARARKRRAKERSSAERKPRAPATIRLAAGSPRLVCQARWRSAATSAQ